MSSMKVYFELVDDLDVQACYDKLQDVKSGAKYSNKADYRPVSIA